MSRSLRHIAVQLDYYMSAQFAGIALACRRGIYEKAGLKVNLLPSCPPGDEAAVVCGGFSKDASQLHVGSMEQNTLLPAALGTAGGHDVKAVAAMFGRSPLCLAALPSVGLKSKLHGNPHGNGLRIAAHSDTVDLLKRILPGADVLDVPRDQKLTELKQGGVDAVQAYDVMETLRLEQ
ncbi:unnamed protein product, partial [Symbiodinium pilosum]